MTRLPVTLLALLLATCQPSDGYVPEAAVQPDAAALLAVNLDDAFAVPTANVPATATPESIAANASEKLQPTGAELLIDGKRVARIEVPADGSMFEGHAAWQVPHGRDVTVEVELVGEGQHVRSKPITVRADADSVVKIRASRDADGKLTVKLDNVAHLGEDDSAAVDYTKTTLPQARMPHLGGNPTRALFSVLRDPQVAVVTPEAVNPDPANHVGPLVAFQAIGESAAENSIGMRAATATVTGNGSGVGDGDRNSDGDRNEDDNGDADRVGIGAVDRVGNDQNGEDLTETSPVHASNAVPAHIRYYSYCTCGKPVANRYYLLNGTRAGEPVRISGHTDWFGMLVARDVEGGSAYFGKGQRERKRHYNFVPGTEQTHNNMLDALKRADPNDVLTALLDLRAEPVESAKKTLVELLDSDNEVIWRNAAVTLSYFENVDPIVATYVALLSRRNKDAHKATFILGALRRPHAIGVLDIALKSENAELRRLGAWAIGFIAHDAGRARLLTMITDPNPTVRAEVALALGRIGVGEKKGGNETLEALEVLMGDSNANVMRRAEEAIVRR